MIAEALADYIQQQGIATVGTDLFIGELPFDKGDCMSLVYSPSPEPNKTLDVWEQVIDFWVRYSKSDVGYDKLIEISDLLHKAQNYDITGFHIYFSNALGMVDDLDRDEQRRKLYKLSIRFIFRKAA
jgi:hypothetical protein